MWQTDDREVTLLLAHGNFHEVVKFDEGVVGGESIKIFYKHKEATDCDHLFRIARRVQFYRVLMI